MLSLEGMVNLVVVPRRMVNVMDDAIVDVYEQDGVITTFTRQSCIWIFCTQYTRIVAAELFDCVLRISFSQR